MVEDLARTFHINIRIFYGLAVSILVFTALALGFILNRVLHHYRKKFRGRSGEWLFVLLESLPLPLLLVAALYSGLKVLNLPTAYERVAAKFIFGLLILVILYFPAKVLTLFLRRLGARQPHLERVAQPAVFLVRALFALLGIIIVLENLGVSLTAVWTTLGVGSVAVALALQDTLGNFFAGLYLMAESPFRAGDYIKLDSGQEGYVVRVGWRSTTLRTLPNNVVVVPNSSLAKAMITNYHLPEKRMALVMPVSVAYGTDPRLVERVLTEVALEAVRDGVDGLLAEPAPFARFVPGFGQSSLDFSLIVQLREFVDQYPVQSELRKRIVERFERENIRIPFPTHTVLLEESRGALNQET